MSRDKKQKYLLYAVLLIVIIAASIFQQQFSIGKIDRCEVAGGVWDFDARVCLNETN